MQIDLKKEFDSIKPVKKTKFKFLEKHMYIYICTFVIIIIIFSCTPIDQKAATVSAFSSSLTTHAVHLVLI